MRHLPRLRPVPAPPARDRSAPERREADIDTLARTLWAAARDRPVRAIEALAAVILNRAAADPAGGIDGACRHSGLFPAWRPDHPDHAALTGITGADSAFAICRRVARQAAAGALTDPTRGATRFHPAEASPAWAVPLGPAAEIGGLMFYTGSG